MIAERIIGFETLRKASSKHNVSSGDAGETRRPGARRARDGVTLNSGAVRLVFRQVFMEVLPRMIIAYGA